MERGKTLLALCAIGASSACVAGEELEQAEILEGQPFSHPAMGLVTGVLPGGSMALCTGTLAQDSCTVQIATHCVLGGAYQRIHLPGGSYRVESYAMNRQYWDDPTSFNITVEPVPGDTYTIPMALTQGDVAVLKLAHPCPDVEAIPLATTDVVPGEVITVAGFGLTEPMTPQEQQDHAEGSEGALPNDFGPHTSPPRLDDSDPLRDRDLEELLDAVGMSGNAGQNIVMELLDDLFTYDGFEAGSAWASGFDATTCLGDSGGPSFRGQGSTLELVGDHVGTTCDGDYDVSFDAQLSHYRDWILNPRACWYHPRAAYNSYLSCGDGLVRYCTPDRMWSASCVAPPLDADWY